MRFQFCSYLRNCGWEWEIRRTGNTFKKPCTQFCAPEFVVRYRSVRLVRSWLVLPLYNGQAYKSVRVAHLSGHSYVFPQSVITFLEEREKLVARLRACVCFMDRWDYYQDAWTQALLWVSVCLYVCICACVYVRVYLCVWEKERERERGISLRFMSLSWWNVIFSKLSIFS